MIRNRIIGMILFIFSPLVAFVIWSFNPDMDKLIVAPEGHFYIVSVVSILATFIAIAVGIAAGRLRNIQVSFLSLGFISLALILLCMAYPPLDLFLKSLIC